MSTSWKETCKFVLYPQDTSEVHVKVNAMRKERQYWKICFTYTYIDANYYDLNITGEQDREYRYKSSYCEIEMRDISSTIIVAYHHISLNDQNYNQFEDFITVLNYPASNFIRVSVAFGCNGIEIPKRISYDSIKTMLEKGVLTDFTIKTKHQGIPCPKLVLADRSDYFRTMFTTPMKESKENDLNWEDVFDEATVQDLLRYIYTASKPSHIRTTCFTLIQASHLCLLEELKELCVAEINQAITKDNVVEVLAMGEKYESEELKEAALIFISEKYTELEGDPSKLVGWSLLDPEMIKSLLMSIIKIIGRKKIQV